MFLGTSAFSPKYWFGEKMLSSPNAPAWSMGLGQTCKLSRGTVTGGGPPRNDMAKQDGAGQEGNHKFDLLVSMRRWKKFLKKKLRCSLLIGYAQERWRAWGKRKKSCASQSVTCVTLKRLFKRLPQPLQSICQETTITSLILSAHSLPQTCWSIFFAEKTYCFVWKSRSQTATEIFLLPSVPWNSCLESYLSLNNTPYVWEIMCTVTQSIFGMIKVFRSISFQISSSVSPGTDDGKCGTQMCSDTFKTPHYRIGGTVSMGPNNNSFIHLNIYCDEHVLDSDVIETCMDFLARTRTFSSWRTSAGSHANCCTNVYTFFLSQTS